MCNQVYMIQTESFHFTEPEFCLGQKVKTQSNLVGYISGLIFYPDMASWCYGLYLANQEDGGVHEIWYLAEELDVCNTDQTNDGI